MAQPDDLFTELQPGSYDGILIPVMACEIQTSSSSVGHKFPHRPGQHIEYTGREPIIGTIRAAYFNGIQEASFAGAALWPDELQALRRRVQEQKSGTLIIPTLGELTAKLTLHETYDAGAREGAFVTIQFEEDTTDLFAGASLPTALGKLADTATSAADAMARLKLRLEDFGLDEDGNAITSLTQFVANLQGNLARIGDDLARPISQATGLVNRIDDLFDTASSLAQPANWEARDALLELRDATSRCVAEALALVKPIKTFVAGAAMSIAQVAAATSNDVADILALNALEDGNAIDVGTELFVYDNG